MTKRLLASLLVMLYFTAYSHRKLRYSELFGNVWEKTLPIDKLGHIVYGNVARGIAILDECALAYQEFFNRVKLNFGNILSGSLTEVCLKKNRNVEAPSLVLLYSQYDQYLLRKCQSSLHIFLFPQKRN